MVGYTYPLHTASLRGYWDGSFLPGDHLPYVVSWPPAVNPEGVVVLPSVAC